MKRRDRIKRQRETDGGKGGKGVRIIHEKKPFVHDKHTL